MRVRLALLALVSLPTIAIAEPGGKDPKTARRYFPPPDPAGDGVMLAAAFKPGTDRGLDFAKMDHMPEGSEDPGSWQDAIGKGLDRGDLIDVLVESKTGRILTEVNAGDRSCAVFGGASCETDVMYDAKSGLIAVHYDHNGKWQLAIELYRVKRGTDGLEVDASGPGMWDVMDNDVTEAIAKEHGKTAAYKAARASGDQGGMWVTGHVTVAKVVSVKPGAFEAILSVAGSGVFPGSDGTSFEGSVRYRVRGKNGKLAIDLIK